MGSSKTMREFQDDKEEGIHGGQLVLNILLEKKMDRDYVIKKLIPACKNKTDLDDYTSTKQRTAFVVAVRNGDIELIEAIWKQYQSICTEGELRVVLLEKWNYAGKFSGKFWTVFMNACKCGNTEGIELIHSYYEPYFGLAMRNDGGLKMINEMIASTLDYINIDSKAKPYVRNLLGMDNVEFIGNYSENYGQTRSSTRRGRGGGRDDEGGGGRDEGGIGRRVGGRGVGTTAASVRQDRSVGDTRDKSSSSLSTSKTSRPSKKQKK